jgi:hypothetical protein
MPAAAALFIPTVTSTAGAVGATVGAAAGATGSGITAGAISASTALSAAALATSVGFGYKQYGAGKEAAKTQQAMESLRAQRSQLQALREAQIQRAMLTQRSATSGTMDSSGFAGGMASIGSQLAGNQMFANQMTGFGRQLAGQQQTMQRYGALSQLSGQAASFGMSELGSDFINRQFS